jgi:hypothetical protein
VCPFEKRTYCVPPRNPRQPDDAIDAMGHSGESSGIHRSFRDNVVAGRDGALVEAVGISLAIAADGGGAVVRGRP